MASHYSIDPALPVLLRPDGSVQVGWHPRRAVRVRPPCGVSAPGFAALLRSLHCRTPVATWQRRAQAAGVADPAELDALVTALVEADVVIAHRRPRTRRSAAIRIHGRGPLSDLVAAGLQCSGARIRRSDHGTATITADGTDLVVLSDLLVVEPRVIRQLHAAAIPHLAVRIRDRTGLVGPMVIPGVTSCLSCADLHRADRDEAWPALAAQLRDTVATADRATVLGTAALALHQIDRVIRAIGGGSAVPRPQTLDTTLEFDVATGAVLTRTWRRHPECGC
ncbi:cyclodehydratase [Mycobacterium sp. MYCO198283]|uniref:cyclodehydratase n=1 Tax=Mycobacterium sp. MYCO198283 TaxID=2883505 RepID=UPI001E5E50D5|nr:cyclodehydratase [Mycobacterium sp. MYCO198283]MCG5431555.1 cyclodehydratase [Mycobacterium sp. MYCO198283]